MMQRLSITALLVLCLTSLAASQFTVTGVFEYEDKAWGYGGWTGSDGSRPIRRADVTVLDDSNSVVLGTGTTQDDGSFSIVASSAGTTDIVVRVNADTDLDGSFQRIRVTTEQDVEYAAFSPVVAGHDTSADLDVGTTTVLKSLSGSQEGNAFNMLDMAVSCWEYITGPAVGASPVATTIRVYWPGGSGSFASGAGAHMAEDDGYDDAVILHELGHVVHNQYSDSDSTGGTHYFGDSDQDPRLSFGEGFATFWGGVIMDQQLDRQAIYLDANGSSQNGGVQLRLRLETVQPYTNDAFGAADEVAVACTLFDILDSELSNDQSVGVDEDDNLVSTSLVGVLNPHRAWWDVFTGPLATASNVTINDAWNGWFSVHGLDGLHADMQALFELRRLQFSDDVDEPNDTLGNGVAIGVSNAWSSDRTLYAGAGNPPAPGTGDKDWYTIDVVVGSRIDIETRYPGGAGDADTQCDTELSLWDPGGTKLIESDTGGTGRNAKLSDVTITETGPWEFRIRSIHSFREYGRYNYRASYVFENFRPEITAGPVALPGSIQSGQTTLLSATAADANGGQVLSYAWTPLSGGTVVGSGSPVTFRAPTVTTSTMFDVQLVVTDELGAESDAGIVTIAVEPSISTNGRYLGTPYAGGPPGPMGTPTIGPNLGSAGPGTVLVFDPHGVTDITPIAVVAGQRVRRDRRRPDIATPVPEHVLGVTASPSGRVEVMLPAGLWPADGGPLFVQFVGRDDSQPGGLSWSTVLEITPVE